MVIACALGVAMLPSVVHAADWYVDAAANGGDGSMGAPFGSLQDGIDAAMPGDSVFVAPGTYEAISTVRDGSTDARITVVSTEPRMATIMADGTGIELQHSHHTFEGLVVDCGYGSGDCIEGGSDAIELLDLEVRRSNRDCIDLRTSSDVLIDGCDIHHCIATFDPDNNADAHGVTGDSVFDLTVRNTTIRLVTGDSVQMSPSRDPWDRLVVESSVLSAEALDEDTNGWTAGTVIGENAFDSKVGDGLNGAGDPPVATFRNVEARGWRGPISNAAAFNVKEEVDFRAHGIVVSGSEIAFRLRGPARTLITNTVVHDVDIGARMEDELPLPRIFNATFGRDVQQAFTDAGGEPNDPDLRNLLFVDADVPPIANPASCISVDTSVFVDAAAHDYHLVEGSTPVDAGENLAEVTDDFDGVGRPFGEAHDIGAYEWTDMPPGTETDGGSGGPTTDGDSSGGNGTTGGGNDSGMESAGSDSGTPTPSSGTGETPEAEGDSEGCGCRSNGADGSAWWLLVLALPAFRRRQRLR